MELKKIDYILIGVILAIIYMIYISPNMDNTENMSGLDSNSDPESLLKVDKNKCSRDCCKYTQWPAPHMVNNNNNNVGTNLMCNAGNGGGCVCVNDSEFKYLSSRGTNGLDSF